MAPALVSYLSVFWQKKILPTGREIETRGIFKSYKTTDRGMVRSHHLFLWLCVIIIKLNFVAKYIEPMLLKDDTFMNF